MKIAIDARGATLYKGTGIGTYTDNLIPQLLKNCSQKDEFTLFCCGYFNKDFISKNTHIIYASGKHGSFYENFYFPNVLNKNNIDLYHIPQNGIGLDNSYNTPTVVTIHDLIPYVMPETVGSGYLENFLLNMPNIIKNSAAIITVSEYSKKDILKFFNFYPEDKIFVTPLAASKEFKPLNKNRCLKYVNSKFNFNTPYILYIGGFSSRKNVLGLIKSFSKTYNNLKKPHTLLIVGSPRDEGEKLINYVSNHNLQDKVIFTGFIDSSLLPILYNGSEAFIYPSFYEGFGLPPLEAMSCSTPVITSNISSIPEITDNNAILINPYNDSELEESICKLLNDDQLKYELAKKGYEHSLNFTWNNTAIKTLNAYKSILSFQ